ncbi:MAG: peptidyl-prolyl cis-trans isomerase [Gammaproteobacteria bacterium]|nr:peptidyl-prolyl cis-trans isomerase [Gammaproteobacteria bacterium]
MLVELHTSAGDITLELWPDQAPQTVANFVRLLKSGFYDGTVFHRVIDGFMIQGGGFLADGTPKEEPEPIPNEAGNGLSNTTGTVAMARTADPHSARSQFFINLKDNSHLDHSSETRRGWGYAVFGKVVGGMDVVRSIGATPTGVSGAFKEDAPLTPVIIEHANVKSQETEHES